MGFACDALSFRSSGLYPFHTRLYPFHTRFMRVSTCFGYSVRKYSYTVVQRKILGGVVHLRIYLLVIPASSYGCPVHVASNGDAA